MLTPLVRSGGGGPSKTHASPLNLDFVGPCHTLLIPSMILSS